MLIYTHEELAEGWQAAQTFQTRLSHIPILDYYGIQLTD
jgi:hypothetical protein